MNAKIYSRRLRTDYLAKVVNQLIDLRIIKGLTLEDLNHKIGVSDYLVHKWETGHKTPSTFNLCCWANALEAELIIVANDNRPTKPPSETVKAVNDNKLQIVE
ncbi:hypothetical protein BFP97_17835 [Roseivirga sp. 4D4]|uniref:helix-turn-helix domain-containing protein n=1 Tax=Roseivirga sp. 4D4 TaxID=1889784 RepID=UPI0008532282|nr:helix-turn-helix transcriptional regulator [Roseivirga sp. 4D4]OEK03271.1 hypothetical protein BFP97_17835 [Roseivirga sp. 4D4]